MNNHIASGRGVRTMKLVLVAGFALGMSAVAALGAELFYLTILFPQPKPVFTQHKNGGALVICGGGRIPAEVENRFVELAGGRDARIVVIPTAHPSADGPDAGKDLDVWKARGVSWVKLLHTRSRETANDPDFTQPLIDATGVWLGGGDQSRLTQAYVGTAVERALKGLLDRGGVVGGSSAGAAAMTRIMIAGGRNKANEGQGFDLLPGAVIDQHFMRRNRLSRLLDLLAHHPGLVGFGIDEGTALVVQGQRLSVVGASYVMACVPGPSGRPPRLEVLKRGDQTDLASLKGPSGSIASELDPDEVLISVQDL
jgi:cyanophycinase